MSESKDNPIDDQLEAYLDNALEDRERSAFEERLRADEALGREVALQRRIDASLAASFPPIRLKDDKAAEVARDLISADQSRSGWRPRPWVWAAAAALVLLGVWLGSGPRLRSPHFEPTPLAQIYHRTVQQGFEPYYECEDPQRFAEVFVARQGQALKLLPMPPGSSMLGLSYPGGLSRDTTAMLCRMDEQPVMVFVDRAQFDSPEVVKNPAATTEENVFREERDGLVFYEVSPFAEARALRYLVRD